MGKKNDGAIFLELPETEEWKKLADKLTLIIFIWFHCVVVTIRQALYVLI